MLFRTGLSRSTLQTRVKEFVFLYAKGRHPVLLRLSLPYLNISLVSSEVLLAFNSVYKVPYLRRISLFV